MKKATLKIIAALLCVCMLIPLYSCMAVNAEEPLTGEEMAEKYFKFDLAPVGDEEYAVSTLIQGLKWGMSWDEVGAVIDLKQGAKETCFNNFTWITNWDAKYPSVLVPMGDYDRKMKQVELNIAKPVEYEGVVFKGGLFGVWIRFRSVDTNTDVCPFAEDFDRYYAGNGNLSEERIHELSCPVEGAKEANTWLGNDLYGSMDCDDMDMNTMTWQEEAVMDWLLRYWTYEEEERMPKLAEAMAKSDEVLYGASGNSLDPVTWIQYIEYKQAIEWDGTYHYLGGVMNACNRTELYKAAREIVARYNELHA